MDTLPTLARLVLLLLVAALAVGCGSHATSGPTEPGVGPPIRVACDRYASLRGSDAGSGTRSNPFRTPERLVKALHPGQTGCFSGGSYRFAELNLSKPNLTLAPSDGEAVGLRGQITVLPGGVGSTIEGLVLNDSGASDIGPRIYADRVTLRGNEITNQHTAICVSITAYYSHPPPRGVVIEQNRIHDCGALPSTNKDHGIYVTKGRDTVIRDNWIYDNADRGVQLYPEAEHTKVVGNVIDGNGEGVVFGGSSGETSNDNLVEGNVITNSVLGWNAYSSDTGPTGKGNVLRNNCVWAGDAKPPFESNGGVDTPSRNFTATGNTVTDPLYTDPAAHDLTLSSKSQCPLAGGADPAFSGPG